MSPQNQSLNFDFAMQCAESLTTIGEREYWTDGAIVQNAKDLVRWCKGCVLDGHVWSADNQAEWLVNEAREQWDRWNGTRALKQLFLDKFAPRPLAGERIGYTTPLPSKCEVCGDTGWAAKINEATGYEYAEPCHSCPTGETRRPAQQKTETEAMRRELSAKVKSVPARRKPQ